MAARGRRREPLTEPLREPLRGLAILAAALLAALPAAPSAAAAGGGAAPTQGTPADEARRAVAKSADASWQWVLASDTVLRDAAGLPFAGIKDIDLAQAHRDAAFARGQLAALRTINPRLLSHEDEITRRFLLKFHEDLAQAADNWLLDFAITPYSGVLPLGGLLEFASKRPLATAAERADYLRLLAELGDLVAQMHAKTVAQREAGILLPKPAIPSLRGTYLALAGGLERRLVPDAGRLSQLSAAEQARYAGQARALVRSDIGARMEAITALLDSDYQNRAPTGIGLALSPGGQERYRRAVATYTTLESSPEELHALGLRLVADTQARMAAIRRQLGFVGTQAEFHRMLGTDPRFQVADEAALRALYRAQIARIEPHVPAYFGRLPRARHDIRRIPAANEGGVAFGYYEKPSRGEPAGLFRYNGANLGTRSMVQAAAINFHELIPGHHFHLALQAENMELPPIRRELASLRLTAYNEGWAQYAANLAVEMGALKDDYELYGLVATDAMMAARLVVDTGVNVLGWDFDRARTYLVDYTLMSPQQASAEVLRYATDVPGQALGYKLGHERILALRRQAETALAEDFDRRAFHDAVLAPGALPLDVLEAHIRRWIASQRRGQR